MFTITSHAPKVPKFSGKPQDFEDWCSNLCMAYYGRNDVLKEYRRTNGTLSSVTIVGESDSNKQQEVQVKAEGSSTDEDLKSDDVSGQNLGSKGQSGVRQQDVSQRNSAREYKQADWMVHNERAFSTVYSLLPDSVKRSYSTRDDLLGDGWGLLVDLTRMYGQTSTLQRIESFVRLECNDPSKLIEFVQEFMRCSLRLPADLFPERELLKYLVQKAPESVHTLIRGCTTLDQACSLLTEYSHNIIRRANSDAHVVAMAAAQLGEKKKPSPRRGGRKPGKSKNGQKGTLGGSTGGNGAPTCDKCGIRGHLEKDCRFKGKCHLCQKEGHTKFKCPNGPAPSAGSKQ